MISVATRVFQTENDFETALYQRRRLIRSDGVQDPFEAASHFIGGAFMADGFRLFRNGGTPLLERREGRLVEEIVLQAADDPSLMAARVHLSHLGLRDVRARYWTTPARAPLFLAGGNVGELGIPPGWVIWDLSEGIEVLERIVAWLRSLIIPWFALFEDPADLRLTLLDGDVPLLSRINALEWMIAEFGRLEARSYFTELVSSGVQLANPDIRERLRSLEACFHLSGRR